MLAGEVQKDDEERLSMGWCTAVMWLPHTETLTCSPPVQISLPSPPSPTLPRFARSLNMAVIQDLPAELLRRVLELIDEYWENDSLSKMLSRTELVARAWRHPSQALLLYNLDLYGLDLKLCTVTLRPNAGRTLKIALLGHGAARATLTALKENEMSVEALRLYGTWASEVDMSSMSVKLLAGAFGGP